MVHSSHPVLSAADKLKTLRLYVELQSIVGVGKALGITAEAARIRLRDMGVKLRPATNISVEQANGVDSLAELEQQLQAQVEQEADYGFSPHAQVPNSVSAADKLRVLELYLRLQSIKQVAQELNLSAITVLRRLQSLDLKLRPRGRGKSDSIEDINGAERIAEIRRKLRAQIEYEAAHAAGPPRPNPKRRSTASAADKLQMLELYLKLQNIAHVAAKLGVSVSSVYRHLTRLGIMLRPAGMRGIRVEDINDPRDIRAIKAELRAQIAAEKTEGQKPAVESKH